MDSDTENKLIMTVKELSDLLLEQAREIKALQERVTALEGQVGCRDMNLLPLRRPLPPDICVDPYHNRVIEGFPGDDTRVFPSNQS